MNGSWTILVYGVASNRMKLFWTCFLDDLSVLGHGWAYCLKWARVCHATWWPTKTSSFVTHCPAPWQHCSWPLRLFSPGHFQVFLQVTTTSYGIFPQLLWFYYKWRKLHELQLPDRRPCQWSIYPSFPFQVLLLTILNTVATQVLGKGKRKDSESERDGCRRHRSRILDGLKVQYQWATIVQYRSYVSFYYRFWKQATSSCVGSLSVTATTVIAYTPLPIEDIW